MTTEAAGKTAALPRSLLHLRFLIDNRAAPDLVLYRDPALAEPLQRAFPDRTVFLGREKLPGKSPRGFLEARHFNRGYYPGVADLVTRLGISRLILFLEGEPLERFLLDLPQIRDAELWEDGLSHYVDLTGDAWYAARGVVQALCGFYPRNITRRRIDRGTVTVRDRFAAGGLMLVPPARPKTWHDAVLLIGSPLVEDRILGRKRFVKSLRKLAAASAVPLVYLPHPREDRPRLAQDLKQVPTIALNPDDRGLMVHAGEHGYRAYLAAVSTGLLDLGRFDRSVFIPGMFGLRAMARTLSRWPSNPVPTAASAAELTSRLAAMPAPTGPAD
ncbi:hypothetical protein [Stakelama tenebrarum]|uniref:Glycosyl transferase n=1 Tax=Stakelama tenebrarum TaxID=2711215 RepID=A0A6G6Y4P9_9SPHN|nr:hypothetical protein [Sphingosinithalassobacter tenebrarum]QIG79546.1 hypothetical protein G5C33_06915 [Sphingosinithalassobacter tenebrarum]